MRYGFQKQGCSKSSRLRFSTSPAPNDLEAKQGLNPLKEESVAVSADPKGPLVALVFKIMTDPYVGRITYARIYSGQLSKGDKVENFRNNKNEKVGRLLQMHANSQEDIKTAQAGDIVAIVGARFCTTGDTLSTKDFPCVLEEMTFPDTVISMVIEPKSSQRKISSKQLLKLFLMKTQLSIFLTTKRRHRLLSPAWVNFTWRLLPTASFVNSR